MEILRIGFLKRIFAFKSPQFFFSRENDARCYVLINNGEEEEEEEEEEEKTSHEPSERVPTVTVLAV